MNDVHPLFSFVYRDRGMKKTLVLFHGTGGSEHDFLFLDRLLNGSYNLLGIRGNVDEHGMSRYFARISPGVFDEKSIRTESEKLNIFLRNFKIEHPDAAQTCAAMGYSNGANMLLTLLFLYPGIFTNVALLHPMMPLEVPQGVMNLAGLTAYVSYGSSDPMVNRTESIRVCNTLRDHGAVVNVHEYPAGHEISDHELRDTVSFLADPTRTHLI